MANKLKLVLVLMGILLGPTTVMAGPPTPTRPPIDTELETRLVQGVADDLRDFRTRDEQCAHEEAYRGALVTALAHLLAHPDAQDLSYDGLAAIYQQGANWPVTLREGDGTVLLASIRSPVCIPSGSHTLPIFRMYVINRAGDVWSVGTSVAEAHWIGDRWIVVTDQHQITYAATRYFYLAHIEPQDGAWVMNTYLNIVPDGIARVPTPTLTLSENGQQVTITFDRYASQPPCEFTDAIDYYSSLERVQVTYTWTGETYVPVGDEIVIEQKVMAEEKTGSGETQYHLLENWPDYCTR